MRVDQAATRLSGPRRWRKASLSLALLLSVMVSSALAARDSGSTPAAAPKGSSLRLTVHRVHDPGIGAEALHLLSPAGWNVQGGILWQPDRSSLATVAMRIWNPNGAEALEAFPTFPFQWTEEGIPFFPQGSIYLGNEVLPPISDPAEFVVRMVVPRHRNKVQPRIIERTELTKVAQAVAHAVQEPGAQKTVRAAKVRLEYQEAERPVHEDIYCVLVMAQPPMLPGTTF